MLFSSSPLNKPPSSDPGRERPLKKLTCSRSPRCQVASLKPELGVLDLFSELPFLQGCRNFFICILTLNMSGAFPGGEQFMLQDYLLIQLIKFSPLALTQIFFLFFFFNFKIFNSYMRSQTLTQIFKNTSESNTVTPHGGTKANTCKTSVITRLSFPKTPADVVNNLPSLTYLGFPGGSAVKNTPAMQETWVSSLGWEDPLE